MFSNIGSALLKAKDAVIGWIGDRIEDFKNGNLGLPEISLESLDTARKAIWQWLQDRWADVKGWFYDKFHNEEGNFVFPVPDIGPLKDGIDGIAQATVRDLCAAHVGRHTQSRIQKVTP